MQARKLGYRPDVPDSRDFDYRMGFQPKALPATADNQSFVDGVLDQHFNDCVAHGIAGSIRALDRVHGGTGFMPSRRHIYYYARAYSGDQHIDDGTYIRDGFRCGMALGFPRESAWPYLDETLNVEPKLSSHGEAFSGRLVNTYERIVEQGAERVGRLKQAIAAREFPVFGTLVTMSFADDIGTRKVIGPPTPDMAIAGGHCMYICGYDTLASGQVVFRVVNSWGYSWGDSGFCWFSDAYMAHPMTQDIWVARRA
jgi:hypothetical protein